MNVQDMTPAQVDTLLADLQLREARNAGRSVAAVRAIHKAAGTIIPRDRWVKGSQDTYTVELAEATKMAMALRTEYVTATDHKVRPDAEISEWYATVYRTRTDLHRVSGYQGEHLERDVAAIAECEAEAEAIAAEAAPLEARYAAERWNRMFLVVSSAGHVHSSRNCQTCRWNTRFGWVPQLSGMTEAEAMTELDSDRMPGATREALCSVCYPNAPVAGKRVNITKAKAARLSTGHLES